MMWSLKEVSVETK